MPQLMPLMWINSVFMGLLILFMYVDMYYYNFDSNISEMNSNKISMLMSYKW